MALAPNKPARNYSFTAHSQTVPDEPQPGNQIDQEIDRTNAAIAGLIAWTGTVIDPVTGGLAPTASAPAGPANTDVPAN